MQLGQADAISGAAEDVLGRPTMIEGTQRSAIMTLPQFRGTTRVESWIPECTVTESLGPYWRRLRAREFRVYGACRIAVHDCQLGLVSQKNALWIFSRMPSNNLSRVYGAFVKLGFRLMRIKERIWSMYGLRLWTFGVWLVYSLIQDSLIGATVQWN